MEELAQVEKEATTREDGPDNEPVGETFVSPRMTTSAFLVPIDPRLLVRGIFLLLGIGVLVPWNAFISAKAYFQARFCDPNDPSEQNDTMESTFAMVYNLSSVISLGMLIFGQWIWESLVTGASSEPGGQEDTSLMVDSNNISENEPEQNERNALGQDANGQSITEEIERESQQHQREVSSVAFVMVPMSLFLVVFLGHTFLTLSTRLTSPESIKLWTLASLVICGICSAMATAGVVAAAGRFRQADMAMNPFLAGQSVGGVAVSLANFFAATAEDPIDYWRVHCPGRKGFGSSIQTQYQDHFQNILVYSDERQRYMMMKVDEDNDSGECTGYREVDWGVFAYFLLGSLTLIACIVGYSWIDRLCEHFEDQTPPTAEGYGTLANQESDTAPAVHESFRRGLELLDPRHGDNLQLMQASPQANDSGVSFSSSAETRATSSENLLISSAQWRDVNGSGVREEHEISTVFFLLKGPIACILLTFFVTLSLFPGLTSELLSTRHCQTHFRIVNDLYTPFSFLLFNVGDLCGRLLAGTPGVFRILSKKLIPNSLLRFLFFPLLFLCPSASGDGGGYQIQSDVYSLMIQFAFALSNGALLTVAFAHAPTLIPNDEHAEKHRQVMSEMLSFSVALGLLSGSLFSYPVSRVA